MNLVVDAVGNKHSGGASVLLEILRTAIAHHSIDHITLLASPRAVRQFELPDSEKLRVMDVASAESAIGRTLWAMRGLDQYLQLLQPDVFLGLNGIGSVKKKLTSLVFIQQSLPYSQESLRRGSLGGRLRMDVIRWITRRSARAASHVFVQTEAMREIISRAFRIYPERISAFMPCAPVLPESAGFSPKIAVMKGDRAQGVLLYVGSNEPYKNLDVVAQGLRRIPESKRPRWYATLPEDATFCSKGAAISLGRLNRAELRESYCHATVLVMPSLIETVGLPMLEAMRLGIPVLAADRPYAHAVCEDAAVFFDPHSPEDFAEKVTRLLADSEGRARMAERGKAIVMRRDAVDPYRAMLDKVVEIAANK